VKHTKAVVVVGISRGGTNITWNLLQSHPQLVATIKELGEEINFVHNNRVRTVIDMMLGSPLVSNSPLRGFVGGWLDEHLYDAKMRGFNDVYARQKSETADYSLEEMQKTALLLKAGDRDMYLVDLLYKTYPELYVITLVRNGFAVCESWMRRGNSVEKTAKRYQHYMSFMLDMHDKYENCLLMRFEDVLNDPFTQTERMFKFANLEPISLPKLRLKTKKVVNPSGEHEARYGGEGAKHWFTRETISDLLVPDQSELQENRLSEIDRETFLKYAGAIMERLGYN
jgi:hypothetical protein